MKEGGFFKVISERGSRLIWATLFLLLSIALFGITNTTFAGVNKPKHIVSLNVCTDQILMLLVPPKRIAALSYLARNSGISVMHRQAKAIPFTYGSAEHVFILKPDLVLAGTYTTRATVNLLKRLKRNLVQVAPARNFEDIVKNIRQIGVAVGETQKAEELIDKMRTRIRSQSLKTTDQKFNAVPYYSNGYTVGKNTLVDWMLFHAGFTSLGRKKQFSGTRKISLETLLMNKPDLLLIGRRDFEGHALAQEVFKHPVIKEIAQSTTTLSLSDALTVCGTPHAVKAVIKLRDIHKVMMGGQK